MDRGRSLDHHSGPGSNRGRGTFASVLRVTAMRYHLRTLLALVTLVAIGLGLFTWARRPSLDVPVQVVDVGTVRAETSGSSVFRVVNRGSRPVTLVNAQTSNHCRFASDGKVSIPPGASHNVWVCWDVPKSNRPSTLKRRIAGLTMVTSDPNRQWIELAVVGQVQ
jgi:hypothetical protein